MKILQVNRVSYAKKDLPLIDREYKISGSSSPVGSINEILEHIAKPYDYDTIIFNDIDGIYHIDVKLGFPSLKKIQ